MKKYVLSLVCMLMCYFAYGQDAKKILREFKSGCNAKYVEVSGSSLIDVKRSIDKSYEIYGFY